MLVVTSHFAPRARALQPSRSSHVLGLTNTVIVRHRQQTRGCKFGWWSAWSSQFSPEHRREMRRRYRILRYKQAEYLNRKLSWEQHPQAEEAKRTFQRFVRHYWREKEGRPGGRYISVHSFGTPDNPTGRRPGQNIEDVERSAMEDLLGTKRDGIDAEKGREYDRWKSPFENIRNYVHRHKQMMTGASDSSQWMTSSEPFKERTSGTAEPSKAAEEYEIDPITNRKVPKAEHRPPKAAEAEISATDSKNYRPQFSQFKPPEVEESQKPKFPESPFAASELPKYDTEKIAEEAARAGFISPVDKSVSSKEARTNNLITVNNVQADTGGKRTTTVAESRPTSEREATDLYGRSQDQPTPDGARRLDGSEVGGRRPSWSPWEKIPDDPLVGEVNFKELDATLGVSKSVGHGASPRRDPASKHENLGESMMDRRKGLNRQPAPLGGRIPEGAGLDAYRALRKSDVTASYEPSNAVEEVGESDTAPERAWTAKSSTPIYPTGESHHKIVKRLRRFSLDPIDEKRPDHVDASRPSGAHSAAAIGESSTNAQDKDNGKQQLRAKMESVLSQLRSASDAADIEAISAVKLARGSQQRQDKHESKESLTGNYVRDFPEEFAKTWTSAEYTTHATPDAQEKGDVEGYANASPVLETSLDRELASGFQSGGKQYVCAEGNVSENGLSDPQPSLDSQVEPTWPTKPDKQELAAEDSCSPEPQGLEISCEEEFDSKPTSEVYARDQGEDIDGVEPASMDESATDGIPAECRMAEASGPTTYKVLAYDPTMQAINMAETTSVVPDTATALTPAEVLLRLSNPAKFFPHFAPLQAQGFEIVSGSGDVLVFRKVRDAVSTREATKSRTVQAEPAPASPRQADAGPPPHAVNPIDMTGGSPYYAPVSANFASPTGYVAYDPPPEDRPPPPSRFRSNIDVRREEPVYSGSKTGAQDTRSRGKRTAGRRFLVGAAWVAGVSYTLGVLGEYFKTGGIDGKGPAGF